MHSFFNPRSGVILLLLVFGGTTGCLFTGTTSDDSNSDGGPAGDTSITDARSDAADISEPDTNPDTTDIADTLDDTDPDLLEPPTSVCGDSSDISGLRAISAGRETVCGLGPDNKLVCWGSTDNGLFGGDTGAEKLPPTQISKRSYRQLDLGPTHACAVGNDDRRPYCWGTNDWSYFVDSSLREATQITGTGKAVPRSSADTIPRPTAVDLPENSADSVNHITAGRHHTCAIETGASRIICWGSNRLGQRGDGTTNLGNSDNGDRPISFVVHPERQMSLSNTSLVAAGGYHTCAVRPDPEDPTLGGFLCWGSNAKRTALDNTTYQIGYPGSYDDDAFHIDPTPVGINGNFPSNPPAIGDHLELGRYVSCTTTDREPDDAERRMRDELHCWGDNTHRQVTFTNNPSGDNQSPFQTLSANGDDIRGEQLSLDVGAGAVCMGLDDTVHCWGDGLRLSEMNAAPWTYDTDSRVIDVAVGASGNTSEDDPRAFVCALTDGGTPNAADNQLRCWGNTPPGLSAPALTPTSVACNLGS